MYKKPQELRSSSGDFTRVNSATIEYEDDALAGNSFNIEVNCRTDQGDFIVKILAATRESWSYSRVKSDFKATEEFRLLWSAACTGGFASRARPPQSPYEFGDRISEFAAPTHVVVRGPNNVIPFWDPAMAMAEEGVTAMDRAQDLVYELAEKIAREKKSDEAVAGKAKAVKTLSSALETA